MKKNIKNEMKFYTYEDFKRNAKAIRKMYLNLKNITFYKWYVYSHLMSERKKNNILMYLNGDITYEKLTDNK